MNITITKYDGTFVTDVFATYENLSEKIEYCETKYPSQEYNAVLTAY
jgi:hypothetical protein